MENDDIVLNIARPSTTTAKPKPVDNKREKYSIKFKKERARNYQSRRGEF
jgi:hypothetical protein